MVDAVNAERERHGLTALTVHPRLVLAARAHSADMVGRGFFEHRNPEGETVESRVLARGYDFAWVAENIAAGQPTAVDVTAAWMGSPGHRANILDPELLETGVGRADGGEMGVYWTQVFGTGRRSGPVAMQTSSA